MHVLAISARRARTGLFGLLFGSLFFLTEARCEIVIDTVSIGHAGNADDTTGFGGVNYDYSIGKYEVTNEQYTAFLNSVDSTGANALALYNSSMSFNPSGGITFDSTRADGQKYQLKAGRSRNAVNFVSYYDAIRFANWMHNGQTLGGTETGAYNLTGGSPVPTNASQIQRDQDARWALVSEDEWYKAAYHDGTGTSGGYSRYPTQANAAPHSDQPPGTNSPDPTNTANVFRNDGIANGFNDGFAVTGETTFPSVNALVDVGSYTQTSSSYGLFDLAGGVHEWNESLIGGNRGLRGGSFWSATFGVDMDDAQFRLGGLAPGFEERDIGFRITRLVTAVPEPSALGWLVFGVLMFGLCRIVQSKRGEHASVFSPRGT